MASERETMERKLYEASLNGNVQALDALMEGDELILDSLSLACFDKTPLHIAAIHGHLDFTRALLSRKPKLVSELDSLGRSPLHMACAEGHAEVARELLRANDGVLGIRDLDGMTPLHVAAGKGRVEVIRELLIQGRRIGELTRGGESVVHLCVKYNRLEALKLLVEWMMRYNDEEHNDFVNSKDKDGNTILHLAAALKQMETIEYLLQFSSIKEGANAMNHNGLTVLDVLEICPIKDLKSMEIRDILLHAGVQRAKPPAVFTTAVDHHHHHSNPPPTQTKWKARLMISRIWKKYFKIDDKWLDDARGNLILSATVIAAMAFQAGVSPPGGVWQDYQKLEEALTADKDGIYQYPGTSIAGSYDPVSYVVFSSFNTVSLMASLFTILLTISGFPLKNKVAIWLLMSAMCVSVASMALAYLYSLMLVMPNNIWNDISPFFRGFLITWIGICMLVFLLHTVRIFGWFFTWLRERARGFLRKKRSSPFIPLEPVFQIESENNAPIV